MVGAPTNRLHYHVRLPVHGLELTASPGLEWMLSTLSLQGGLSQLHGTGMQFFLLDDSQDAGSQIGHQLFTHKSFD